MPSLSALGCRAKDRFVASDPEALPQYQTFSFVLMSLNYQWLWIKSKSD